MNKKEMLGIFQNPGSAYRGKPFWSWNGELDEKELIRQVGVMREMGFGGFFMHSRSGLITEYLGDEWFRLINAVADEGARQGMEVWLYDEDRWPSGSAGGKATEDVRYRMKSVYVYERAAAPYISGETELPECDYMFAARLGADGYTMSDYIQFKPGEAAADVFARLTGEGEDKLLEMRIQPDEPSSNYNGNTYLDTMNVEAVDKFIELTHEQYLKRCGKRLGSVISGIFTDEPHRGQALDTTVTLPDGTRKCGIFYTNDIFDEFERRYGYDVQPLLPQIFYRLHGEPISRVRLDYFDLGCNLFNERFIERINDWCERHGIILTGHVLHAKLAVKSGHAQWLTHALLRAYGLAGHRFSGRGRALLLDCAPVPVGLPPAGQEVDAVRTVRLHGLARRHAHVQGDRRLAGAAGRKRALPAPELVHDGGSEQARLSGQHIVSVTLLARF